MKQCYLILMLTFCSLSQAQNVVFPDLNFEDYLLSEVTVDTNNDQIPDAYIDTDQDGAIQVSEAEAVASLYISPGFVIGDLTGIQAFSNLKHLKSYVAISSAQLNSLTNLEKIDLSFSNAGGTITVSGLTHLKCIDFSYASYDAINLSGLPNLEILDCSNNNLTALDCSGLTNLKEFNCSSNQLTSFNISGLTQLKKLTCGFNTLTTLNLSSCNNLKYLDARNFAGTTISLSNLTNLEDLEISGSALTSIDVSQLSSLESLSCHSSPNLAAITLGNLPSLKFLYCFNCNLATLNINGTNNLEEIICNFNTITVLNVTNKPNLKLLWCFQNQITTLDVANDTDLTDLNCSNNSLSALNVTNLTNLTSLDCSQNSIATLDLSNLTNLERLDCSNNTISSIDTQALTRLLNLNTSDNPLHTLSLTNLTNLSGLYCSNNDLTALSISHLQGLRSLDCSRNQLTALELPTVTYFYSSHGDTAHIDINCSNNLFETIDFSPISCNNVDLQLANNPNLTYVNLKNNRTSYNVFSLENCPILRYICINAYPESPSGVFGSTFYFIDQSILDNIQINSYCSFVPGGIHNTITGTFSLDTDNNGCDANDFHFSDSKIVLNDSTPLFNATYTNTTGNYNFYTQDGTFTVIPKFENPYFTVSPATATVTFADSNSNIQTQNFCVVPNGVHNDVEVTLIPIRVARPGFYARYQLVFKNKGNQTLSGSISLTYNGDVLNLFAANPAISGQSLNTLTWNYSNLIAFESRKINLSLNVNSPTDTPAVNIGDILNFSATIDPVSGDETVSDNTSTLAQMVRGSFDPNDKTCLEGSTITPEKVGDYLHYIVRFQNSGTAAAESVVVKDVIDTTKFDITTLELLSSSHPHVTLITGSRIEFQFENINLPAESEDEPGSHGYVVFKIKTKANLTLGNSVTNKADIYFDYNSPITTNNATTTVALLGVNQFVNTSVNVAPNPVKDQLHISAKSNITSIALFDIQGRILQTQVFNGNSATINLSQNPTGIYFVKIQTDQGVKIEKIIKE